MIVVSVGWEKTCATYKNNNIPQRQFLYQTFDSESFQCAGPQYTQSGYGLYGPHVPNGAEFIAAAVSQYEANNNIS